jgi:hypothetical protein
MKLAAIKKVFEDLDCRVVASKDQKVYISVHLHANDIRFVEWQAIDDALLELGYRIEDDMPHLDANELALVAA